MRFIGGFFKFARRVMDAAKKGGLAVADLKKLDNLLTRTGKRNTVLAKGILSALTAGGSSDADVERFGNLLKNAEDKISNEQEPFTDSEGPSFLKYLIALISHQKQQDGFPCRWMSF